MSVTTTNWSDPSTCPFCGSTLADPGAGFIDHIDQHDSCRTAFDAWRENLTGDIAGGWTG